MMRRFRNAVKSLGASTLGVPWRVGSSRVPLRRGHSFSPLDRLEWSLRGGVAAPLDLFRTRGADGDLDLPPSLYAALRAGGIIEHRGGKLAPLLESIAAGHSSDFRHGRAELLARLRSQGAGGFLLTRGRVAISHPRRPLILPVTEPSLTVCLADEAVEGAGDEFGGATTFLVLVCPTVGVHLSMLTALSRLIAAGRFLPLVESRAADEEVMDHVWLHDCGLDNEEFSIPLGSAD
ncbi:MAG: hypothetical protein P4L84_31600 [Isosphaeraceae bacterium]|nr:hypothetical protein [Isosphaeraceae bacterium]